MFLLCSPLNLRHSQLHSLCFLVRSTISFYESNRQKFRFGLIVTDILPRATSVIDDHAKQIFLFRLSKILSCFCPVADSYRWTSFQLLYLHKIVKNWFICEKLSRRRRRWSDDSAYKFKIKNLIVSSYC